MVGCRTAWLVASLGLWYFVLRVMRFAGGRRVGSTAVVLAVLLLGIGCSRVPLVVEPPARPDPAAPTLEPAPHPVSLGALMLKELDGGEFTVGRVLAENEAYTRYYVTYRSGGLKISGIMNVPRGRGPFPLLILNHGYIDTDVYTNGRGLRREQDYLARQGFVVVHPDYRNHADSDDDPEAETSFRLGYTEDVINAVYAVRTANLPYVDARRVGMLGHSMGGGITQNVLVVEPELVQAAVLYAPVASDYRANYERYTRRRPEVLQRLAERYGSIEDNPRFWAGISAATYFERVGVPVQVHIGTSDESVEPVWSYAIRDRLQALGKPVELHEYLGEQHEFGRDWELFMQRTAKFFQQYVAATPP